MLFVFWSRFCKVVFCQVWGIMQTSKELLITLLIVNATPSIQMEPFLIRYLEFFDEHSKFKTKLGNIIQLLMDHQSQNAVVILCCQFLCAYPHLHE